MLSSHYQPINECIMPQYHYVAYEDGLGPSRLVHDAEIATKYEVSYTKVHHFPYHHLDCHIMPLSSSLPPTNGWPVQCIVYMISEVG